MQLAWTFTVSSETILAPGILFRCTKCGHSHLCALYRILERALGARLADNGLPGESLTTLLGFPLGLLASRDEAGLDVVRDDDVVCLESDDLLY